MAAAPAMTRRWLVAALLAGGALHAALNAVGFASLPRSASPPRAPGIARGAGETRLEALDEVMKDPERAKELQAKAEEMLQDPEKRRAVEEWQQSLQAAVGKLEADPELAAVFADVKENGPDAFEKYRQDEDVMKKFAAAQAQLNEEIMQDQAARELEDELIQEIFAKFDKDKDGILCLEEFNALQAATEGPEATYQQEQLEALLLAVNPEIEEPSRGMPFADYRRLYVDRQLSEAYNTDVVRDHGKIFGTTDAVDESEPGSIPDAQVPGGLFAVD